MPAGNPPSAELNVYLINSDTIGAFGPTLSEITRLGLNEQRFVKGADRGEVTFLTGIHFAETEEEAVEFLQLVTDLQGKELTLYSTSTDKDWLVFLRSSRTFYRPHVSTDPLRSYIIRLRLEVQRTK